MKALHRLIVSSDTFRQASHASPESTRADPENLLLARGPALRLPAEHIRDSALAASGLLVRTVGGPSVKPYQPEGLWEQSGTGQTYTQDTGDKLYRRSLYTFWRRTSPPPSMTTFDAVSREVCVARREVTIDAAAVARAAQRSAVRRGRPRAGRAARPRLSPRTRPRVTARPSAGSSGARQTRARATILAQAFDEQQRLYQADAKAADGLLGVGQAPRDAALPAADVAATASVASLIMNFDAFVVTR